MGLKKEARRSSGDDHDIPNTKAMTIDAIKKGIISIRVLIVTAVR